MGQQDAAGQGLGQQGAARQSVVQAQGQPAAAALGQGCQGQGQGRGQGGPAPPPRHAAPPPPFVGGAGQAQERGSATRGGRAARGADRQGRPSQRRGAAARLPPRGGGLLSLGFTRQVQSSGEGGRPTPHSRTCTCGRGWGSAQPEVWAGSLLRGSHIGRRPRSFRRAAIRWGGGGGKGLIYLYTAVYR